MVANHKNKHIYNSGIIGNCAYIGHVNKEATINWLCWPYFDSSTIFGSLLDKKLGYFSIQPEFVISSKQYYLTNTNILCTEFICKDGEMKIIDFAPRFLEYNRSFKPLMLFRHIKVLKGYPKVKIQCKPTYNYGKITPDISFGSNHIRYLGLPAQLRLTTELPLTYILEERSFVITQNHNLVLSYGSPLEAPLESIADTFLEKTIHYWRGWISNSMIPHLYQKEVIRSLLTLKLHQFEDTGAIIASSTTSLPEFDQSTRNWDYRYCWIRDSYYTLNTLYNSGKSTELKKYSLFLLNLQRENQRYAPLYSIKGGNKIDEQILDLKGYLNNQPVRIGNQAKEHIQNDAYGQILVSILPLYVDERYKNTTNTEFILNTLKLIQMTINEEDAGIWEFRNKQFKHCYTSLFHWAGACASLNIGKLLKNNEIIQLAEYLIKQATKNIENCYDAQQKAYTHAINSPHLDASLLQLIIMGYLDPKAEKTHLHLQALESTLKTKNNLFYRYLHEDDFGTPKTTFLICSFWYVEALACVGRIDESIKIFEQLLSYTNHLGLLSEDVDHENGGQWGNFPQTYSHVGLVNAAFKITDVLNKPLFI